MHLKKEELLAIGKLIQNAERILLICHKNPDGDTLGAGLGLYQAFTGIRKQVTIFCVDEPAPAFRFMPNVDAIVHQLTDLDYDVIFVLDAGATHLTGLNESHPQLFDKSLSVVNIDHHVSNNFYGKHNLVVTQAAATTAVVYQMLTDLGIPVDRQAATCLLTGLYTDTGSFKHSNTDAETLRIGAKLLARGADLRSISKSIFNTSAISRRLPDLHA